MKKIAAVTIAIFVAFFFQPVLFANEKDAQIISPNVVARFISPARFFRELSAIMREVYPNPKLELQAALSLMPFGYPNFNGISKKENLIVCVYNINTEQPVVVAALKMYGEKEPVIAKTLDDKNNKIIKNDGYIFVIYNARNEWKKYLDVTAEKTKDKRIRKLAKIELDTHALKLALTNVDEKALNDIHRAILIIDKENSRAKISIEIEVKDESLLKKKIEKISRAKVSKEAEFIPQNGQISIISKASIPRDLLDFTNITKLKQIDIGSNLNETFALSANLGDPLKISSVGATKITNEEFLKTANDIPSIKLSNSISNEIVTLENVKCVKTSISKFTNEKIYSTIFNGYSVSTSNETDMINILNKISNAQTNAEYPLKKYVGADCDVIAVANTKAILESFIKPTGARIKDEATLANTFATINFNADKIQIFFSIDLDSLRYFVDCHIMTQKK